VEAFDKEVGKALKEAMQFMSVMDRGESFVKQARDDCNLKLQEVKSQVQMQADEDRKQRERAEEAAQRQEKAKDEAEAKVQELMRQLAELQASKSGA